MKQKILKIIKWALGIIVAILAFIYLVGLYGYDIQNYFMAKRQEKMRIESGKQIAEILEAQKNDTYGGKTPEETLDLYIAALKAGDIELASKYYEVSVENNNLQNFELTTLKRVLEEGKKDVVIKEAENIRYLGKKTIFENGNVSFVYKFITKEEIRFTEIMSGEEIVTVIPKGTELDVGNALRLNPYTKVWKIIQ
jgi:hypothetical protein